MSIRLMTAAWSIDPDALKSPRDRFVLVALADSADDATGECWPSVPTIARRTAMDAKTVRRALAALVAGGWVTSEMRTRPNGSQQSNLYTVNLGGSPGQPGRDPPPRWEDPPPTVVPLESSLNHQENRQENQPSADAEDAFNRFWGAYPRKVGKPEARRRWKTAVERDGIEVIRSGFKAWVQHWRAANTHVTLIPHPATWLHQQRYNDTPPPVRTVARAGTLADQAAARIQAVMNA